MGGKHWVAIKAARITMPRRTPIAASLMGLFGLAGVAGLPLMVAPNAWAQARPAANALPVLPTVRPKTDVGSIMYRSLGNNAVIIEQKSPTSIVTWKSFDIGSAASVTVAQPSATSVLLNKVEGGAVLNRTTINGMLNANGRVYIQNSNGVVFGKTSQVNVNTLVASSLKFDESRVIGGFLQPGAAPMLDAGGAAAGAIVVEAGASLTANNGGLIMLAGPQVINNGRIVAPDGQVVMAAGNKVYLAAPNNAQAVTLRGLLVEVSDDNVMLNPGQPAPGNGLAENSASGTISVGRGNTTMIGYAVNQKGTVSASTSASLNGSIYLYARDHALSSGANSPYVAQRSGQLVLGPGSVTQVLPTLDDNASVPLTSTFNKSEVKLFGANIALQENASIKAPGGNVTVKAARLEDNVLIDQANMPTLAGIDPASNLVRVDFAPGSSIDVSGSTGAQLAMESNVITVDLRGTELADNAVLRDSPLYASKVQIDIRNGAKAAGGAANISGWLALVERKIGEVNTAGGTVAVSSDGAIIQRAGSKINVDGGYVDYLAGKINTTKLKFNDTLVDIASASANTLYSAVVNLPNSVDEVGYRQGSSAGTVQFSAPIVVLQGSLSGKATAGIHQRDVSAAGFPTGGKFELGTLGGDNLFGYAGNVFLGTSDHAVAPQAGAVFDVSKAGHLLLASSLRLDPAALRQAGFNSITALTSGNIEVNTPVALAAGGKLELRAGTGSVIFGGTTLAAGGNVSFTAPVSIPGGTVTAAATGVLQVADGLAFDLAGRWTNDIYSAPTDAYGNPVGQFALNGGFLNLSVRPSDETSGLLKIGNGVSVDVSAGAWYDIVRKTTQGTAGSITLAAKPFSLSSGPAAQDPTLNLALPTGAVLQFGSDVKLSGYGYNSGGKLTVVGKNVTIGAAVVGADPTDLSLQPTFFEQGGFTSYDVAANVNLDVLSNALITPHASSWQFKPNLGMFASGAIGTVAAPVLLDLSGSGRIRAATSLTLRALAAPALGSDSMLTFGGGALTVADGAQIKLDPGASLNLLASQQLTENGTLSAPGGEITLALTASPSTTPFRAENSIWFGPKAKVLAGGSTERLYVSADRIASGDILDGGTIRIGNLVDGVLNGAYGYVVAQAGSMFDVSGVGAGLLHLKSGPTLTALQNVSSSGGSIEIRSGGGLLFDGTLRGGAGGADSGAGALTVVVDGDSQSGVLTVSTKAPSGGIVPAKLQAGQAIVENTDLGAFLTGYGTGANARRSGQGWLQSSAFSGGDFGSITFKARDALSFGLGSADLTLSARDALILDAPLLRADDSLSKTSWQGVIGKTLTLSAPYIQLGSADAGNQLADYLLPGEAVPAVLAAGEIAKVKPSTAGNAFLKTSATTVDLIGNSATQGFGDISLAAKADIRLVGMPGSDAEGKATGYAPGSLSVTGNLSLLAAQIYPTTLSDFTLSADVDKFNARSGTLTFASNGNVAEPVLSAGGSITGLAANIVQDGRLFAPFGAIYLGNGDTRSLSYSARSVTSVAGAGVVPFGIVNNSTIADSSDWVYFLGATGTSFKLNPDPTKPSERALPSKAIVSQAQAISTSSGAVLDVAGGGSLSAYAFDAGKGGSRDVLNQTDASGKDTAWAINPNFHGAVAPLDAAYGTGGLAPGASVYLSGVPGLPAGNYTLLPAHYALLQGGFSISVAPNTRDLQPSSNRTLQDGSMLVSGHLTGTGAAGSSGFLVASGTVLRTKSEFGTFDANKFFTAKADAAGVSRPELPVDGGRLAFNASGSNASLALDGVMRLSAAAGGRAGYADFTAQKIQIVSERSQSVTGAVKLVADDLTALGADSIFIGGLRDARADALHLTDVASAVTLSNDALHPLSGSELVLVASNSVKLDGGASIKATGKVARAADDIALDGAGALLRVSSGAAVVLTRGAVPGGTGTLVIGSGATVGSSGSAYLDGSASVLLRGKLDLAPGSAFGIGATGIDLGSSIAQDGSGSGVQFDTAALAMLSGLSQMTFNSYGSAINLYGTVNLGGAATKTLEFKGAGLRALGTAAREATFTADTVRFDGTAVAAAAAPSAQLAGALTVQANQIEIGSGAFVVRGYADSVFNARTALQASGTGGSLVSEQGLTLAAARITAASGADATFEAGGKLNLTHLGTPTGAASGLGGSLNFKAASIASDALIEAPSGQVQMLATGGGIAITGGQISTAGDSTVFGSTTAYAPGGSIALSGTTVMLGAAAELDVSAIGAAAGSISIATAAAGSHAQLDATLKGAAVKGIDGVLQSQGTFALDTDQAGDYASFGGLNAKLNASGFTQSRQFRFRNGNVVLGKSGAVLAGVPDEIIAQEVIIAADNGSITLDGAATIDTSGIKGGSIELYAAQATPGSAAGQVTMSGNARLLARGTGAVKVDGENVPDSDAGSVGNGGRVVIGTASIDGASVAGAGSIDLQGGTIDVSGSSAPRNGSVTLRAPQIGGSDVAIANLTTNIVGSAATVIDGYKVYTASSISEKVDGAGNLAATLGGKMYTDASSFIGNKGAIMGRLGLYNSGVLLQPGIEVRAPDGSLTVSVNEFAADAAERSWNLNAWRFDGAPVELTLRAKNDLTIFGSISDGFVKPTSSKLSLPDWELGSGPSASYRFVGGADFAAANPLAVVASRDSGDVLFGFADRTPTSDAPLKVNDAPVALVRTGTGRIDIAAGRDVNLAMAKFFTNESSDASIDGTPVIFDKNNTDGSYIVTLYGASVYTAGQASGLTDAALFTAPKNALNTHYGAAANTLTSAKFASGGGGISIDAKRDVNGPHNLGRNWYYRNDGIAAVEADPTPPATPAEPAIAGDIVYLPTVVPQLINNWLFRQGRSYVDANGVTMFETTPTGTLNTAWWTRYDYFNQGVATFGGGDVRVVAGAKITDLSVSVASNAYAPGAQAGVLKEQGGGDLLVRAGADILGGTFYVQKGTATLHADGSIGAGNYRVANTVNAYAPEESTPLNPVLALGDATFNVSAGRDLSIESVFNPTLTAQSVNNVVIENGFSDLYNVGGGGPNYDLSNISPAAVAYRQKYGQFSNFSTYGAKSAVHFASLGGDLTLSNDAAKVALAGGLEVPNKSSLRFKRTGLFNSLYSLAPSTFSAVAFSGDLTSLEGFNLMASPLGQLDLLAANNITLHNTNGGIRMLDNDPSGVSTASAPRVLTQTDLKVLRGEATGISAHMLGNLHAGDSKPVHIIALTGDIIGEGSQAQTLTLAKQAEILAGRDIVDLGFNIQQNKASDVTTISAGRDFIDVSAAGNTANVAYVVTGPGRVDLVAGRNVDLGAGAGLVTRGNLENPYLAEGGAAINVVAGGAQADYKAFVAFTKDYGSVGAVVTTLANLTAADRRDLKVYLLGVNKDLPVDLSHEAALALFQALPASKQESFLSRNLVALLALVQGSLPAGAAKVSKSDAWAAFRAMAAEKQAAFLDAHAAVGEHLSASALALDKALVALDKPALNARFFSDLVEAGQASKLNRFDALITSLLPINAKNLVGNIALYNSQIKTEQGGAIDLFAPTGSVYAGLTVGVAAAQASTQGIFTIRGGALRSLVKNDFQVNQGRVFTLGGGDITLVSQYGSIDAGKGAKTASSAPPPQIKIDANGNVTLDVSGSISGSGIATLSTRPGQPISNVYATAPRGVFDAGDAGVRSTGTTLVNAPIVLNAVNISAGGGVSGASAAVQGPSVSAVAGPSNAAPQVNDVSKTLANADPAARSASLAVEVLGYGDDEDAAPDADDDDDKDDAETKKKKKAKKNKQQQPT